MTYNVSSGTLNPTHSVAWLNECQCYNNNIVHCTVDSDCSNHLVLFICSKTKYLNNVV